jgi:hypothetical protein
MAGARGRARVAEACGEASERAGARDDHTSTDLLFLHISPQ